MHPLPAGRLVVGCVVWLPGVCQDYAGPVEEPDTNERLRLAAKDPLACRAGLGVEAQTASQSALLGRLDLDLE